MLLWDRYLLSLQEQASYMYSDRFLGQPWSCWLQLATSRTHSFWDMQEKARIAVEAWILDSAGGHAFHLFFLSSYMLDKEQHTILPEDGKTDVLWWGYYNWVYAKPCGAKTCIAGSGTKHMKSKSPACMVGLSTSSTRTFPARALWDGLATQMPIAVATTPRLIQSKQPEADDSVCMTGQI